MRIPPVSFWIWPVMIPLVAGAALAASGGEITEWPAFSDLWRVLTLRDYNTRVVLLGTTLLGVAAGLTGTFLVLRKRALLSDAISHATLPGIALAFITVSALGGDGKNLLALITGAGIFSVLGTGAVLVIQRYSRIKDDAALGISLSVFFGLGVALMGIATRMETGNAAGLGAFIYGKTASMLLLDALLIAATALISALCCVVFLKEFTLICFDRNFAAAQGWPVGRLDFFMMALVVVVTVIGLQAVGLILVVALLIIPPSAARFWTHRLDRMLWLSALFGALSGCLGAAVSALMVNLPAGAIIVLAASSVFGVSLLLGTDRGLVRRFLVHQRLSARIAREHLLRALFELDEEQPDPAGHGFDILLERRSWTAGRLRRIVNTARSAGLVTGESSRCRLTPAGRDAAAAIVRTHRLWETYLITHADVAPGRVDWGADQIEHVLEPEIIRELEALVSGPAGTDMPASPHSPSPAREEY